MWALLTSAGVDAVLRHGCRGHTSSLLRTAATFHGEVGKSRPHKHFQFYASMYLLFNQEYDITLP